jgi:hypothetical protein
MSEYKEPDLLQMYFAMDYQVTEYITIRQPRIGEIVEMGEEPYYQTIGTLCVIPSDIKSMLWDSGIDWEIISDFELFCLISKTLSVEQTRILFGDLDFSKFKLMQRQDNQENVLYQRIGTEENFQDIIIDKMVYQKSIDYIRKLHRIHPKVEHAKNKKTKEILIQLDREDHEAASKRKKESHLFPLISSLVNTAGFKYKKDELKEVGIFEFFDSVMRIQTIKSADALLKGCYSGFVDTSGINKKDLDWTRDLYVESNEYSGLMTLNQNDAKAS